jgi:hypothetical protein
MRFCEGRLEISARHSTALSRAEAQPVGARCRFSKASPALSAVLASGGGQQRARENMKFRHRRKIDD